MREYLYPRGNGKSDMALNELLERSQQAERRWTKMSICIEEAIDILERMSVNHFYGHREMEAMRMGAEALRKMDKVEGQSECVVGCDGYCEECPMGKERK